MGGTLKLATSTTGSGSARCWGSGRPSPRASFDGHQIRSPMSNASAGTSTERTRKVSSSTPKAITKPISARNTSGRTRGRERAGQHDARRRDDAAGHRQPAEHARAACRAAAPPRARGPSGRCCSRPRARPGTRTPNSGSDGSTPGSRRRGRRRTRRRPSAATNDSTTVAISSSGATSARSSRIEDRGTRPAARAGRSPRCRAAAARAGRAPPPSGRRPAPRLRRPAFAASRSVGIWSKASVE